MEYTEEELRVAPWLKNYGEVPFHLDYPDISICRGLFNSAEKYPKQTAISFEGKKTDYAHLAPQIIKVAKAFSAMGIKEGDSVTVCLPNTPQGLISLYALNYIGAVASMIHPLSAVHEIAFYIKETNSRTLVTLDQFYAKVEKVKELVELDHIVIVSVSDALSPVKKAAYRLFKERRFPKFKEDSITKRWKTFLKGAEQCAQDPNREKHGDDIAVVLFSGGTTGTSKGILLTNGNFNALAMQTLATCNKPVQGHKMLAAMPIFHGFGLGVCIHTVMFCGGESILVPQVTVKGYSKMLKKAQPNYIAGVPTLFEGITRNKDMDGVDLSCLMGVFSGGDSLSIELKKKIDKFLLDHGSTVTVREGYGTTECVTASCLTPYNMYREGSIGFPYPDTYFGIFRPGTQELVPYGEEGEICLRGPSVMKGYIGHEEENKTTLQQHPDGFTWLHTGDMGTMDEDGFIYFKQRIKRMIVTSGYNVYPSQIENIIDGMEEVRISCCIGIPDPYRMHIVKAFVCLKPGYQPSDELKQKILDHCKEHVAKYAMPRQLEFRDELPKTLVGKIAYTVLEKEELAKMEKTTL